MKLNEQKEATKGKCVNNTERRSGFNAVINVVCRVCMYRILCSAVKILEYHLLNGEKKKKKRSAAMISALWRCIEMQQPNVVHDFSFFPSKKRSRKR